jgi:hypothetical protein
MIETLPPKQSTPEIVDVHSDPTRLASRGLFAAVGSALWQF